MILKILQAAVLLIFFNLNLFAQNDTYLYARKNGESAKEFVERNMVGYQEYLQETHNVIEGVWGDITKGKKIMAFYNLSINGEYNSATMIVFQPVGDGENYIISKYENLGNIARYYNGVISIFFLDVDEDGYKELVLIEKGEARVPITFEEIDEDGKTITEETTACCEDVFDSQVIKQLKIENGGFLPFYAQHPITMELNLIGLENAIEVKKAIRFYLEN